MNDFYSLLALFGGGCFALGFLFSMIADSYFDKKLRVKNAK